MAIRLPCCRLLLFRRNQFHCQIHKNTCLSDDALNGAKKKRLIYILCVSNLLFASDQTKKTLSSDARREKLCTIFAFNLSFMLENKIATVQLKAASTEWEKKVTPNSLHTFQLLFAYFFIHRFTFCVRFPFLIFSHFPCKWHISIIKNECWWRPRYPFDSMHSHLVADCMTTNQNGIFI